MAVVKEVFPGRMLRFEPAVDPDEVLAHAEDESGGFDDLDAEDLDTVDLDELSDEPRDG